MAEVEKAGVVILKTAEEESLEAVISMPAWADAHSASDSTTEKRTIILLIVSLTEGPAAAAETCRWLAEIKLSVNGCKKQRAGGLVFSILLTLSFVYKNTIGVRLYVCGLRVAGYFLHAEVSGEVPAINAT